MAWSFGFAAARKWGRTAGILVGATSPSLATMGIFVKKSPVDDEKLGAHPVDCVSTSNYLSNPVCEDRWAGHIVGNKVMTTVFDGHGGWQTAEFARTNLGRNFEEELGHAADGDDPVQVGEAMSRAFIRTDKELSAKMLQAYKLGFFEINHVGACVCSVVTYGDKLVVANAGDCRAVLGQARGGKPVAIALSEDHNAKLPKEQAKLAAAHPGEMDIVKCRHPESCYVKGRLQPTRSLGDFYLKDAEFHTDANAPPGLRYRHIRTKYTPPYITATPDIFVRDLDLSKDSFVIIATDGLWDEVSNEEAVSVVANDTGDRETVAARLVEYALTKAAHAVGLPLEAALQLQGRQRRGVYDDITVLVVFLDDPKVRRARLSGEALEPTSGGGGGFFSRLFGGSK